MVGNTKIGSLRLPLKQKEFNKLKKSVENIILEVGGTYEDTQNNSKVKSKYRVGDKVQMKVWHTSYSDNGAKKNAIKDIKIIFRELGIQNNSTRLKMIVSVGDIDFKKKYSYKCNFDEVDDIIGEIQFSLEPE